MSCRRRNVRLARRVQAAICVAALAGCERDAPLGSACPHSQWSCIAAAPAGATPTGGRDATGDMDAATDSSTDATAEPVAPLSVAILDAHGQPIAQEQLTCDAPCLEVSASARGGQPPYAYQWADAVEGPTRTLCPDSETIYTVRVRDSSDASPSPPPSAAEVALRPGACTPDGGVGPAVSTDCETFTVGEYLMCGNAGTSGRMPRLHAGAAYTLHARGNLATAGSLQVAGVGDNCGFSEVLGSWFMPVGPSDVQLCVRPSREETTLIITVLSGGSAEFLTNADSVIALCSGCE
jgi:hypothetical protein